MVCMQFPTEAGRSYLTTELAGALIDAGHQVDVLHLDWAAVPGDRVEDMQVAPDLRVVRFAPRPIEGWGGLIRNLSKFLSAGRRAVRTARTHLDLARYDAALLWMPASATGSLIPLFRRAGIPHRLLFVWDVFPHHHREIGRIPGGPIFHAVRLVEQRLLAQCTAIFCTLPGNADYLRRHYRIRRDQQVGIVPIWTDATPRLACGDRVAVRRRHGLPPDRPIAVFGGQLVEGRGFGQMLAAADAAMKAGSPLLFLFVGDGRMSAMIRARASERANVLHLPAMSRAAYLDLLGACDVGMVATVPGVTSFSIPSKTLDYLRAGLPVVAAVEHGSDFPGMLDRYRVGEGVPFAAPDRFFEVADRLARDPGAREAARRGAPRCLAELFDVRHAVTAVLDAIRPDAAAAPRA